MELSLTAGMEVEAVLTCWWITTAVGVVHSALGSAGGDLNSGEGAGTCPLLWWVLLELFGGEDGSY